MQFGNLFQALIFGLAAMAAVMSLYFLKLRRRSEVISSTLLWQKTIQDLKVNSPFQRLRASLLLLLQLLLLALAAWALAGPTMWLSQREGKDFVFVLDNSASMNATDVPGGRFAEARRQLLTHIDNMTGGDEGLLITCGGSAKVLGTFSGSREQLRLAAKSVQPTDCRTNLHEALSVALSLARMRIAQSEAPGNAADNLEPRPAPTSIRESEVHLFSDGGFDDVSDLSRGKADVIFHPVGSPAVRNVGITHLDAQRIPGTERSAVFAGVQNFSAEPVEAVLSLYFGSRLLDTQALSLEPGKQDSRVFNNLPVEEGILQLKLEADDDLATDNVAWVSLRGSKNTRILLVTPGNFFLQRALDQPGCDLKLAKPGTNQPLTDYDVVVFDRCAPEQLPDGNFLFFYQPPPLPSAVEAAPDASTAPVEGPEAPAGKLRTARTPVVADVEEGHPVARYANLWELQPAECVLTPPPPQAQLIVESDEGPLIWVTSQPEGRLIYCAFDIYRTYNNWPLRVSFPLFISNAVEWLAQGSGRRAKPLARTGDILTLAVEESVKAVTFRPPVGSDELGPVVGRRAAFGGTRHVGVYTVEPIGGQVGAHKVAVNLVDADESDIAAREAWTLRGVEVARAGVPGKVNRDVWWWFALGALAFLAIEWYVYHRRVFA